MLYEVITSLLPEQIKEEPKPLSYFYNRSLSALMMAKNPLVSESKSYNFV